MITDVARFIACDYAADRVPRPGGLVHNTDLRPGQARYLLLGVLTPGPIVEVESPARKPAFVDQLEREEDAVR